MVAPEELERLIRNAFPGAVVDIVDLTGTRDHYQVRIVAEAFRGVPRMRQHRMVHAALGELLRGPIHALSLSTACP
jgi:stress-induced morphogen